MTKNEIRTDLKAKRRALTQEEINKKSENIFSHFMSLSCYDKADTVMVYLSAYKEPETRDIIGILLRDGKKVVVPISNTDNFTITPSYLVSTNDLKKGAYDIPEPNKCTEADINSIDIALIPGIAFDEKGSRIGFGKGYYDRFLSGFHGTKIGICYDFQLISDIPVSEHDIKMDMIITEKRIYNDF